MRTLTAMTLILLVPAVAFAAGGGGSKNSPFKLERIEGSDVNRVILTAKAAERAGVETATVREDTITRKWTIGGLVVEPGASPSGSGPVAGGTKLGMEPMLATNRPDGSGKAPNPLIVPAGTLLVRVPVSAGELQSVVMDQPAQIVMLKGGKDQKGLSAKLLNKLPIDPNAAKADLYYALEGHAGGLAAGQRVGVEIPRKGSGERRKIVPYSAVIYDLQGTPWIYVSPEPLVFVRHRVDVDYVEGDDAFLKEGPAVGTKVVSVGVAELYGADTGVTKAH